MKPPALPNLIIIGAQKCGTTSLHYYLGLHPQIAMSKVKELDFFIEEMNWHRGLDWYCAQFRGSTAIRGETSPNYTMYPLVKGVAERMHAAVPQAKLIYVVRHPIERIISHYIHAWAAGLEDRSIAAALADLSPDNRYICRSLYYRQIAEYLPFYAKAQILPVAAEQLLAQRPSTMQMIFRFLGVDDRFETADFAQVRFRSAERRRKTKTGQHISHWLGRTGLQRLAPDWAWHLDRLLCMPFSHPVPRPALDAGLRRELAALLSEDTARFKDWAGGDFVAWSGE